MLEEIGCFFNRRLFPVFDPTTTGWLNCFARVAISAGQMERTSKGTHPITKTPYGAVCGSALQGEWLSAIKDVAEYFQFLVRFICSC